jgi:hypothetical protein
MRRLQYVITALAQATLIPLGAQTTSVTVGAAQVFGGNCIPFGCFLQNPNIRYQQVYDKSRFSGPIEIAEIRFFFDETTRQASPTLNTAAIALSLSTTSASVGALNLQNLDLNVGANNRVFTSGMLGGPAPPILSFLGKPFRYDPAGGNLLLDITFTGASHPGIASTLAFYQGSSLPPAVSPYSRSLYDFGSALGLVTEFRSVIAVVRDMISMLQSFNLANGLTSSLSGKLQGVVDALAASSGSRNDAVAKLQAFIGEVQAQGGKGLTDQQASALIAKATAVSAII